MSRGALADAPLTGEIVAEPPAPDRELLALDKRIDVADNGQIVCFQLATMARWEFGRRLLAERRENGGKQLPAGRMAELCELTGKGEREIRYRMQFAELCPSEVEVGNALQTFGSWREMVQSFADAGPKPKPLPKPSPSAQFLELARQADKAISSFARVRAPCGRPLTEKERAAASWLLGDMEYLLQLARQHFSSHADSHVA